MKDFFGVIKAKWMAFADILLFVNTRIILFFIYFFVLGPIAILMKIFQQDPIERKINPADETFFKKREKNLFELERYKRQF